MTTAIDENFCVINSLPEIVLVQIFSHLTIDERCVLVQVCKLWYQIVQESYRLSYTCIIRLFSHLSSSLSNETLAIQRRVGRVLSHSLTVIHDLPQNRNISETNENEENVNTNYLVYYGFIYKYMKQFQYDIRHLHIHIEQQDQTTRYVLCKLLNLFSHNKRQIRTFSLSFIGFNPMFMKCSDITNSLRAFFHHQSQSLLVCDLSGVMFSLDDDSCITLSKYNQNLLSLNLQDQSLVCCITAYGLMQIIENLKYLNDLWVDMIAVTDDVLQLLLKQDDLKHLGLRIRREEKYSDEINPQLWRQLREKHSKLRLTLNFDITTPLNRIAAYMKPEIQLPVQTLILNTPVRVYNELIIAANNYHETLENVYIQTTAQWVLTPSEVINEAILYLAERCPNLKTLYYDCALDPLIIEHIYSLHPHLKEQGASKLLLIDSPTHNIQIQEMADLFG
ncbi:unnamed protein product [Didymodactylos carnosus]|uniref:F-box domain-containing protein n=1 Tax=Didymodactylos carnosus TaxID=1234261 RepID=A0A814EIG2_9BILA|nr:unnamed protein product [Didymodactylos carnosus]CAF1090467.1 unnamed protein product [Didymodactylos carnosus]CAF3742886.1 unnamed protein product [Didymodactylos carnosus]CAF3852146.1 unnamed protein product [Didymodactylos carnosus]